jgi:hypothetical protein
MHGDFDALVINCGSASQHIYIPADTLVVLEGNCYGCLLSGPQTELMQQLAWVRHSANVDLIRRNGRVLFGIGLNGNAESPVSQLTTLFRHIGLPTNNFPDY